MLSETEEQDSTCRHGSRDRLRRCSGAAHLSAGMAFMPISNGHLPCLLLPLLGTYLYGSQPEEQCFWTVYARGEVKSP